MLRYRTLPVVAELEQLEAADTEKGGRAALDYRNLICSELFQSKGFQLVTAILRQVEGSALAALRAGVKQDYQSGRMSAVDEIRRMLGSLSPEVRPAETEADEVEEAYWPSGFDIPLPSGA